MTPHRPGRRQPRSHPANRGILPAVLDQQCIEISQTAFGTLRRVRGNGLIEAEDPTTIG